MGEQLQASNSHRCVAAENAGIFLGTNSWVYAKEELRSNFPEIDDVVPHIIKLISTFASQGIQVVPILIPSRPMIYPPLPQDSLSWNMPFNVVEARNSYRSFYDRLVTSNVTTPNILNIMLKHQFPNNFFLGDHHITPSGSEQISIATYNTLRNQKIFKDLKHTTSQIIDGGVVTNSGPTRGGLLKADCDIEVGESFRTVISQSAMVLGLLDEALPEVAYVGTSMGRSSWGLPAYLRSNLSLDIIDFHVEAGGIYVSLLNYVSSNEFHEYKPKMILWEIPFEDLVFNREGSPKFIDTEYIDQIISTSKNCKVKLFGSKLISNQQIFTLSQSISSSTGDFFRITSDSPIESLSYKLNNNEQGIYSKNPIRSLYRNQLSLPIQSEANIKLFEINFNGQIDASTEINLCRE